MPTTTLIRTSTKIHKALYRLSRGRIGRSLRGGPIVFLTTTGRKTGKHHTWPLVGTRENWVVLASNGGQDVHPSWYLNLQTHPDATLEVAGVRSAVHAEDAKAPERDRIWTLVIADQPIFAGYQKKTDRQIPVVVLRPAS